MSAIIINIMFPLDTFAMIVDVIKSLKTTGFYEFKRITDTK